MIQYVYFIQDNPDLLGQPVNLVNQEAKDPLDPVVNPDFRVEMVPLVRGETVENQEPLVMLDKGML